MIVRNPQFLALLLVLPALVLIWLWQRGRLPRAALAIRLAAVAVLVLALADPTLGREPPPPGPLVILADQSDSLGGEGQAAVRAEAARLAGEAGTRATVLSFGANVVAQDWRLAGGDPAATPASGLPAPVADLDPAATDLAAALRMAHELLAPGGGRIVLLSDGQQNQGDALSAARQVAASGIAVDVRIVDSQRGPEIAIAGIDVPRTLRAGEEYPIRIVAARGAGGPTAATLQLWENDQLLAGEEVALQPGDNEFTFRHRAAEPGVIRLRAELKGDDDTFARNNYAAATVIVAPPPQILLVEGRDGAGRNLAAALRRAGVESALLAASDLPLRLSELNAYDGMVLIDVPASMLSLDQMATVREFVRSEGRGLVVTGGRNSFGLGAYKGTPLEQVLPVQMEPPPRPQRADIALLLIIDRSASMTTNIGVSKFDMAKEAAILSTETLQGEDRIGILSFDTGTLWVVPFQQIGQGLSLEQIQDAIAQLPSGGGTDIYTALEHGITEMMRQQASVRHVVLLTDGRSFTNDMPAYEQLINSARAEQISLSTIAIGGDSDTDLLDTLAQWGGGRYYFAAVPEDIPRLTLLESEIARADPTVEEAVRAQLETPNPMVRDFAPAELPQLDGYVATTVKEGAEVVLRSPADDPLLVAWQYGLGRSVAWTPSVEAPWAGRWPAWPDYDRFWAQVVRYTLPDPESGPLQLRIEQQRGGARLTINALQPGGDPLDLATVSARVRLPDNTLHEFMVRQVAPGRYVQDLRLTADGAYAVSVVLIRQGQRQEAEVGYVQPVPPEYRPAAADAPEQGRALLARIAELTGGSVSEGAAVPAEAPDQAAPATAAPSTDLWPWLLGAALLLWVLEIALRRGMFVRQEI